VAAVERIFRAVAVSAIRKRMREPVDTEFLVRRIGQLWAEAANLPEKSPVQERIEKLAGELSDYVSGLYDEILRAERQG
jgi:hypothetical protein